MSVAERCVMSPEGLAEHPPAAHGRHGHAEHQPGGIIRSRALSQDAVWTCQQCKSVKQKKACREWCSEYLFSSFTAR